MLSGDLKGGKDFLGGSKVKNPPVIKEMLEMPVQSLGWEDPLEEGMPPTPVFLPGDSYARGAWWAAVCRAAKSQT